MQCDKVSYPNYDEALKQVVAMSRYRKDRHTYKAYKCPFCKLYHLTTLTKVLRKPPKQYTKYPIRKEDFFKRK
jgi:hypothetical protein